MAIRLDLDGTGPESLRNHFVPGHGLGEQPVAGVVVINELAAGDALPDGGLPHMMATFCKSREDGVGSGVVNRIKKINAGGAGEGIGEISAELRSHFGNEGKVGKKPIGIILPKDVRAYAIGAGILIIGRGGTRVDIDGQRRS